MTKKLTPNVTTVSVGTEQTNEFKWARQVSDFVGTRHHELVLTGEQVMSGILRSIYENEIFDGFQAEVQSPLYNLVEHVHSMNKKKILTGYGADLLFGGVISADTSPDIVNKILNEQINRTKWTGEFSPYIANKFNIELEHPFWNSKLIAFAMSLDGNYKKNAAEVKVILREMAHMFKYLPDEITWRKKIGIHESTSIKGMFSTYLGAHADSNSYDLKNLFTYNIFKRLYEEKQPVQSIDLTQLAKASTSIFNNDLSISTRYIIKDCCKSITL